MLLLVVGTSCTTGSKHKVLVIHSLDAAYKGYQGVEDKIQKDFREQGVDVDIRSFYLDCEYFLAEDEIDEIKRFLNTLGSWKPEVILVYEDQAVFSLLKGQHPLVKETPIVFAGVNFPNWALLKKYPNVSGTWYRPEYMKTAEMVTHLFGHMQINIWADTVFLGKQHIRCLLEQLASAGMNTLGRDTFSLKEDGSYGFGANLSPLPKSHKDNKERPVVPQFNLLNSRASSSSELVWTRGGWVKYAIYVQSKRDIATERLGLYVSNATFTVVNEGFGVEEGLLGGYFTSFETEIEQSVGQASEVLKGKDIRNIPIVESPKEFLVDWVEMQRWKIDKRMIPADYRIINMPFYERYKSYVIVFGSLSGILFLSLFIFLIYLYRRENHNKKQAQIKFKQGERFLSLAIAGGKVFAFQLKDSMFSFDSEFCAFVNIEEGDMTLDRFRRYLHPDDVASFNREIAVAYKIGHSNENISRLRCNFSGDGYQWWECRYTYNEEENLFSGLYMNIQKSKEAEQELIDARLRAEESDKMKSAFLANMSHEIRTPLNAIVGFSNLIGADEVDLGQEEKTEFMRLINMNCELLLKLINDILDLSRIESGRMSFTFADCDLTDLMSSIYSTHLLMMPEGVELKKEVPALPVIINTDKLRLNQVITNLINNAVKFTSSGYIKIGYEHNQADDTLHVFVEDTGIGIPEEKQNAVFERFNKLDEFAQGTGLGLAICQVITARFQGRIQLSSAPGKGSRFTVIFPRLRVNTSETEV